ncbi:hypothetical protein WVIC16_110133 [Weissella viridescens]|nr:hypothetical protein WVIC16_110133 [Weissella viridescens]
MDDAIFDVESVIKLNQLFGIKQMDFVYTRILQMLVQENITAI